MRPTGVLPLADDARGKGHSRGASAVTGTIITLGLALAMLAPVEVRGVAAAAPAERGAAARPGASFVAAHFAVPTLSEAAGVRRGARRADRVQVDCLVAGSVV